MFILYFNNQKNKRTDYPGKEIANKVQKKWDKKFKNEIGHSNRR